MRRVYVVLPFLTDELADQVRREVESELGYVGVTIPGELLPDVEEAYREAALRRDEEGS